MQYRSLASNFRKILLLLFFLFLLQVSIGPAQADEVIVNGGLETSTFYGWTIYEHGSGTGSYSIATGVAGLNGTYCGYLSPGGTDTSSADKFIEATQYVDLTGVDTISMNIRFQGVNANLAGAGYYVYLDNSTTSSIILRSYSTSNNILVDWTTYNFDVSNQQGVCRLRIAPWGGSSTYEGDSSGARLWFDNVTAVSSGSGQDGTVTGCVLSSGNDAIFLHNMESLTRLENITIPGYGGTTYHQPYSVDVHGSKAYIACIQSDKLVVLNMDARVIDATVDVGDTPRHIAVSPDGTRIYVANSNSNTVSIIDASTNTVIGNIAVTTPYDLEVLPDGSRLYILSSTGTLTSWWTNNNTQATTLGSLGTSYGMDITPDGSAVYIANYGGNNRLYKIWTNNNTGPYYSMGVAGYYEVKVHPNGQRVYIPTTTTYIKVFNTNTNLFESNIGTSNPVLGIDTSPDGSKLYAVTQSANLIPVFSTSTGTLIGTINNLQSPAVLGNFVRTYLPSEIDANFVTNVTTVTSAQPIQFTDTSTGSPTSRAWDFNGDGVTDSTVQNPIVTYGTAGTYTVSLTATNEAGSDTETKVGYITITDTGGCIACNFTGTPTSGSTPLTIQFTDLSAVEPDTWAWSFGDGGTSTEQNPTHTYSSPGTYTVTMTVTKGTAIKTKTKTGYITVTDYSGNGGEEDPGLYSCDFTANITYGTVPLTVLFNDTSLSGADTWTWGVNGVYQADTENVTIVFNNAGIYTINHTASGPAGSSSKTKTNYIQVYPANYGGIYGFIYDANTNLPLANVNCQLSNSSATATTVSDSEGYYYFWPVWNGIYNLNVSKTGYVPGTLPNTIINGTTLVQNIYLTPSGDQVDSGNITNYSSNWLDFNLYTIGLTQ